ITFDQAGGGDLTVVTATSEDGDVSLSVDSGDLTVQAATGLVRAGCAAVAGNGNVSLATTTSGDLILAAGSNVTALCDTVSLSSAGSITQNGTITADTLAVTLTGDIVLGAINGNNLSFTAGGSILDDGFNCTRVVASSITLTANNDVGRFTC